MSSASKARQPRANDTRNPSTASQAPADPALDCLNTVFGFPAFRGAQREIGIALEQGRDDVQVFGQDHGGLDPKGMLHPHFAECPSQRINTCGQQPEASFGEIDREKITAPRPEIRR